jgi:membrane protein implicated in regulation of membrane protease activity
METIFLACFVFGLLFTLASVALGFVGGGAGHFGHVGHAQVGHAGHVGAAHAGGHDGTHAAVHNGGGRLESSLPLLNASSVIGGVTWFGAAGYVLTRLSDWALPVALLAALIVGGLGWYVIARFLGLILKGEVEMDPDDYRLEGTVAKLTVGIPAGGTGEVVFEKAGTRRSEAARALGGAPIGRGSEVVITSYADGFAIVQPWVDFVAEREKLKLAAPTEKREA